MLNRLEYNKFKLDFIIKTFVHEEQFAQWLRKFFYLNYELSREYDTIYQDSFYVVFYELTIVGLSYSKEVLSHLENRDNHKKTLWYRNLVGGLEELKNQFTEVEFEYIKYRRHSSSHIFQNSYEHQVFEKGEITSQERENRISTTEEDLKMLILKHGGDKNFDLYMHHKIFHLATNLYNRLRKNNNAL